MEPTDKSPTVPPYLPNQTFFGFTDKLKSGVPARIDRSVFNGYSGSAISQIISAMRYLGLITENGTSTQMLRDLVAASGDENLYRGTLNEILSKSYGFMYGFDLGEATQKMIDDKFREAGASGDTVRKCVSFYVALAQKAGWTISPHLRTAKRASSGARRKSSSPRKPKAKAAESNPAAVVEVVPDLTIARNHAAIRGYFQELPAEAKWDEVLMEQWIAGLRMTLAMVYKVKLTPRGTP